MKKTLNQIIDYLDWFHQNHNQINSFSFGEINEISNINDVEVIYPLLHCQVENARIEDNNTYLTINHLFMDLTNKSENNTQDVLSDTLLIANDLHQWLALSQQFHKEGITIDRSDLIPFTEHYRDEVSGWNLRMTYKIKNTGICNIPFYSATTAVDICADFAPNIELNGGYVCAGTTRVIRLNSPTPGVNYNWYNAAEELVNTGVDMISYGAPEEAGQYTIIASNADGCSSELTFEMLYLPTATFYTYTAIPESTPGAGDGFIQIDFNDPDVYNYSYELQIMDSSTGGSLYMLTQYDNTQFFNLTNDRYTIKANVIHPVTGERACGYIDEVVLA